MALIEHEELTMEVRGRDLVDGLPKTITLSSFEIRDAIKESLVTNIRSPQSYI